jgi:hypothetical protein
MRACHVNSGRLPPPFTRIMFAGMATIAVSAVGATTLLPGLRPVTTDVAEMAAIDESNTRRSKSPTPICTSHHGSDRYPLGGQQPGSRLLQLVAVRLHDQCCGRAGNGCSRRHHHHARVGQRSQRTGDLRSSRVAGGLRYLCRTGRTALPGKVGAYEIWNEPNAAPYYGPQPDPGGPTGAADRSRAGQAAQTTLLPRRARERMSQR